jgi:hypothetical protein
MAAEGNRLSGARDSRRLRTSCGAGLVAAALILPGCMIPSYHLPGGFSSSYQRQLYGMEPVPPDPYSQSLTSIETHAGIFYPMTTSREAAFPAEQRPDVKNAEPMRLPPEPPVKSPTLPAIVMAQ